MTKIPQPIPIENSTCVAASANTLMLSLLKSGVRYHLRPSTAPGDEKIAQIPQTTSRINRKGIITLVTFSTRLVMPKNSIIAVNVTKMAA